MPPKKSFAVLGGDSRQVYLANALAAREDGSALYAMFLEKGSSLSKRIKQTNQVEMILPQSDVVVFPLPFLNDRGLVSTPLSEAEVSLQTCLAHLSPQAVALAGKVPPDVHAAFRAREVALYDYLEREEFAVLNALPTAEGAVEIALRHLPFTLFESSCLVTGYGRIGRVLARLLGAFGAKVSVASRERSELAWVRADGFAPVPLSHIEGCLPHADILFNTIPAVVLDGEKLSALGRRCLIIDLASGPGGVDFEAANRLGLRAVRALSLPGKVAPESAGKLTLDAIFNILDERRGSQCQTQP